MEVIAHWLWQGSAIAVVTAGLSDPSSTRLLSDLLGDATLTALTQRGLEGRVEVIELRPLAQDTVRAAASGCPATYAESDRAFHRAMLAFSGNEELVRIACDLHRRAQWPLVGGPVRHARADLVADAAEHVSLLEALVDRDLDVVRELVAEHFAGAA